MSDLQESGEYKLSPKTIILINCPCQDYQGKIPGENK